MILRNGVEIKKLNKEFSHINQLLGRMRRADVSRNELITLQSQIESGLMRVATYIDKIDKVWVNRKDMRQVYTDYNRLVNTYGQAKLQIAMAGHDINYNSTDRLWMNGETRFRSNINYLNNPNNSRTKDRVHYVATRGLILALAGALFVGAWIGIDKYKDMKNENKESIAIVETLEEEKKALEEEIKELKAEIFDLEKQLEEAKKGDDKELVAELEAEIADLKEQLKGMVSQQQYDELLEQNKILKDELKKAQDEVKELKGQIQNAATQEEVNELKEKLAKAEAKVLELEGKLERYDEVIAENETLTQQKEALEDALDEAEGKIADLEAKLDEAIKNNTNGEKDAEIAELKGQLEEANKVADGLQKSLDEANAKIDQKDARIAELVEENKNLKAENSNLKNENADLKEENEDLKEENEQLKSDDDKDEALKTAIDLQYSSLFGNDGAGKTHQEKLTEILQRMTEMAESSDGYLLRSYMVDFIVDVHYNSPGYTYPEVFTWTDEMIIEEFIEICGEYANAGDGVVNENVKEEVGTTTPGTGTTTPEQNNGDAELSPDQGIVHE